MSRPLTGQELADAVERVRARVRALDLHAALCPAVLTQGRKACRCGCSPIQALVEDYTTGEQPKPIDLGPVWCEWGDLP